MAGLARASQPWLRNTAITTTRFASPRSLPTPILVNAVVQRHITQSAPRWKSYQKKNSKTWEAAHKAKRMEKQLEDTSASMLLPLTFVAPLLRDYPKSPLKFLQMGWHHFRNRVSTWASILGLKLASMKGWFTRPEFKFNRSVCVPTVKAMHFQMSEAYAAGDLETLKQLCTSAYYLDLAKAINRRPANRVYTWELVRYTQKLTYPKLSDWRCNPMPGGALIKQAVVSIASVQRIAQYENGQLVPGSERERNLVENIVIQSTTDDKEYKSTPWKIWGKVPTITYEQYMKDLELMNAIS